MSPLVLKILFPIAAAGTLLLTLLAIRRGVKRRDSAFASIPTVPVTPVVKGEEKKKDGNEEEEAETNTNSQKKKKDIPWKKRLETAREKLWEAVRGMWGKLTIAKAVLFVLWFIGLNLFSRLAPGNWYYLKASWPFPFWAIMAGVPLLIFLEKTDKKHGHGGGESLLKNWGTLLMGTGAAMTGFCAFIILHRTLDPRVYTGYETLPSRYLTLEPHKKVRMSGVLGRTIRCDVVNDGAAILVFPNGRGPGERVWKGKNLPLNCPYFDVMPEGDVPVIVDRGE